jgi:hypothetical protein
MGAWGQSKRKGSLEKMEEILQRMEQGYEETLEADVRPNTISYVTVSVLGKMKVQPLIYYSLQTCRPTVCIFFTAVH